MNLFNVKKNRLYSLLIATIFVLTGTAQVPKKTMVEHFTNTKCSICASRNPGFYSNLNAQNDVLYLSIHPSSPYSGCLLYQQNATENDARTNFYGIYGGTPRLVLNGSVISPTANYSDNSLFTPFLQQTSPALIKISQIKYGNDSIRSRVVVKTVAAHTLGGLSLFIALAEDTIVYTGSNGEPKHFNVFRKGIGSVSGFSINLPANIGDSVVISGSANYNSIWNFSRINTLAILQERNNKNLVQAEIYSKQNTITAISENSTKTSLTFYPNPGNGIFEFETQMPSLLEIRDSRGELIMQKENPAGKNSINLSSYSNGIYFVRLIRNSQSISTGKLVLVH